MKKWILLKDLVHNTVKILEKQGAEAEAFFTAIVTTEVSIRNSEILTRNSLDDAGVGFRVVKNGKVGFASTNTLTEKAVMNAGEKALAIAKVSSEVPGFTLPGPGKLPAVQFYDPQVAHVEVEEVVDIAKRAITAAEAVDQRVVAKTGRVVYQSGWRGIVNTNGIDCEEQDTKAALYLGGVGEEHGEVTGYCSDYAFRRTADLEPESVGETVGKNVVKMFSPQPVEKCETTVIFGPEAGSYQLTDVLIDALKGENVVAGRSAWARKVGDKVAAENVTVTDSGILKNGFSSRKFDDEGYPSQDTVLIEKGNLLQFIHHATSATILKMQNTGNASRSSGGFDMTRMIIGAGYRTSPEVYPSTLVIEPGTKSKEALISEVEKGVLIEAMDGFAQKGSGLISARLSRAFYINHGEIQYPVIGMVSGIGFDWFNHISGIGNDVKQFDNAAVPSLRVENVAVVG